MSTTDTRHENKLQTFPPIGWETAGIRLTPAEFDAIQEYDALYRYELIDGVLVVNPIPHESEAAMNELLSNLLHCFKQKITNALVSFETLPNRYVSTVESRYFVSRVIWAGLGRRPHSATDVPTIAVKFVSAGRRNWLRDYEIKRDEYLAVGVREYWIIDRFARSMTVHRPGKDQPETQVIAETETYQTPLLPGFELPLAQLLAEADKWND